MNKNIIIPAALMLLVLVLEVLFNGIPLSIGLFALIIGVSVILFQQKTKNDWGMMFIGGIGFTIVMIAVLILLFLASNHIDWLRYLLLWPYN